MKADTDLRIQATPRTCLVSERQENAALVVIACALSVFIIRLGAEVFGWLP